MGLTCARPNNSSMIKPSGKSEAWTKNAGYLFRPGFYNELTESVYEKSQLQYHISWRKIQQTLRKRNSVLSTGLYNQNALSQWKPFIRNGVPDSLCRDVLLKLFQVVPSDNYWRILKEHFEGAIPENFITVPTFSSIERIDEAVPKMYLNSNGVLALKRVLWAIHKLNDGLNYCPQLPPLISILLIYLNEEEAFSICHKLIENPGSLHLMQSKQEFNEFLKEIVEIVVNEQPKLQDQAEMIRKVAGDMTRKLFLGYFRISCVLRITLVYLFEGKGIIAKIIAAVFSANNNSSTGISKQTIPNSTSLLEAVQMYTFSLPSCDNILKIAYNIKYSEDEIIEYSNSSNVRCSYVNCSKLVSQMYLKEILSHLDSKYQSPTAKTIQTSNNPSLSELLKAASNYPHFTPMICIFLTENYEVCGFFTDCALSVSKEPFGGRNVMIFSLEPETKFYNAKYNGTIHVSEKCIKIGNNKPAMLLDGEPMSFTSNKSIEFESPQLFSSKVQVQICELIVLI